MTDVLAIRTIPVADTHPVQLPLALIHEQPIERARTPIEMDPEPVEAAVMEAIAA